MKLLRRARRSYLDSSWRCPRGTTLRHTRHIQRRKSFLPAPSLCKKTFLRGSADYMGCSKATRNVLCGYLRFVDRGTAPSALCARTRRSTLGGLTRGLGQRRR